MKSKASKPPPPPKLRSVPLRIAENPEAKQEYLRVMAALGDKVDARDQSLLVDYCLTHAEIINLQGIVDNEGYTLEGAKGGTYTNPTVNILASARNHLAQLRRDLYFTPKSRIEKQKNTSLPKAQSIRDSIARDDDDDET